MVSPHTPVPAYLAISFQAIMGYGLFSLFKVNFLSIFLLSILAMMESAIQKLLILTFSLGNHYGKRLMVWLILLPNNWDYSNGMEDGLLFYTF